MALRTTDEEVRALLPDIEDTFDLTPWITTANTLTDYVSSKDSAGVLTAALLQDIEKYLAAHFACHKDQQFTSRSTGGASGAFQGQFGMRLESSHFGQTAMMLDVTGTLAGLHKGKQRAGAVWLGKRPSEQTHIEDRS